MSDLKSVKADTQANSERLSQPRGERKDTRKNCTVRGMTNIMLMGYTHLSTFTNWLNLK